MNIALYARVSTKDKQEVENQLCQLRQFAALPRLQSLEASFPNRGIVKRAHHQPAAAINFA